LPNLFKNGKNSDISNKKQRKVKKEFHVFDQMNYLVGRCDVIGQKDGQTNSLLSRRCGRQWISVEEEFDIPGSGTFDLHADGHGYETLVQRGHDGLSHTIKLPNCPCACQR
jgi:hypothetical protein